MTTGLFGRLELPHGTVTLPSFLPDATRGVVRSVDRDDLTGCGVQAVVMNTFHLMVRPGSSTVNALGGLHRMTGWEGPIVTDSGGFQAYSLIRQSPKSGRISERGLTFRPDGRRKFLLTPEKSIQLQVGYGADVVICLDDCTHIDDAPEVQATAVDRTLEWARRGRETFDRLMEAKKLEPPLRPKLFAVVQGGADPALRRRCAEALLEIGFDGYGYGGWPLDAAGRLVEDMLASTRALIPDAFPMHALGVGHPDNVVTCARLGYQLFDSAMPTRDARNGRLYVFRDDPSQPQAGLSGDWLDLVYIHDDKHTKAADPVSSFCDGRCCRTYSTGYLHHLHKIKDSLYPRLATIHNLRFMARLTELVRRAEGGA